MAFERSVKDGAVLIGVHTDAAALPAIPRGTRGHRRRECGNGKLAAVIDVGRFTVGVFQDALWARRGVEALLRNGFVPESLTILALDSPSTSQLIEELLGAPPSRFELKALGAVSAKRPARSRHCKARTTA